MQNKENIALRKLDLLMLSIRELRDEVEALKKKNEKKLKGVNN